MKAVRTRSQHLTLVVLVLVAMLSSHSSGCATIEEPELGETAQTVYSGNGLWLNGLWLNGLWLNGLWLNGVGYNALGFSASGFDGSNYNGLNYQNLLDNEIWQYWMTSSSFTSQAEVFDYIVRCALDSSQTIPAINIGGQVFGPWQGEIGMAPAWHASNNPTQTTEEQMGVSACLLSLVNALGEHVVISLRSTELPAPSTNELLEYTQFEGQFFGNVFASTPVMRACRADGSNMATNLQLTLENRLCALDPEECNFEDYGACSEVCDSFNASQGVYETCDGYITMGTYIADNT